MSAYPNPFNPRTTISFTLPAVEKSQAVSLQILNLQGQLIETLINQQTEARYHQVIWDATNHPSGVYIAKLIAGDFTQTQKLVLVK